MLHENMQKKNNNDEKEVTTYDITIFGIVQKGNNIYGQIF